MCAHNYHYACMMHTTVKVMRKRMPFNTTFAPESLKLIRKLAFEDNTSTGRIIENLVLAEYKRRQKEKGGRK